MLRNIIITPMGDNSFPRKVDKMDLGSETGIMRESEYIAIKTETLCTVQVPTV